MAIRIVTDGIDVIIKAIPKLLNKERGFTE